MEGDSSMSDEAEITHAVNEYLGHVNFFLRGWRLTEIRRLVVPSNFGNAEVVFSSQYLSLRVIRERLKFHVDLGPRSAPAPGDWFGADIVLAFLAHRRGEMVPLPMSDEDVLSGLRVHRGEIHQLFDREEFASCSKSALTSFRRSLRPEIAARMIERPPSV
jgi:hypothetical protein